MTNNFVGGMVMMKIDARGFSCPQPVVMTLKAIRDGQSEFEVLVNTVVSKENVLRCLAKNGYNAKAREEGDDFIIAAKK